MLGANNAIFDDGEWISWDEINQQIEYKEWEAKYPHADHALIPILEQLLSAAQSYHETTGSHLQVYGDIGELFGAITYGIKLHRNYAQGSDGRLGNDFVEVKTITPFKNKDEIEVNLGGHFNKLLIIKVNNEFEISHRLIDRKSFSNKADNAKKRHRVKWSDISSKTH